MYFLMDEGQIIINHGTQISEYPKKEVLIAGVSSLNGMTGAVTLDVYNKTEVNAMLATKADIGTVPTAIEVLPVPIETTPENERDTGFFINKTYDGFKVKRRIYQLTFQAMFGNDCIMSWWVPTDYSKLLAVNCLAYFPNGMVYDCFGSTMFNSYICPPEAAGGISCIEVYHYMSWDTATLVGGKIVAELDYVSTELA
jgi:hypothetical protein